ncbi:MAG: thiamine-phosphate kinase [Chloroflexota bacterium]
MRVGSQKKPIKDVGEFGLIRGISNLIRASKVGEYGVELGIGDDAALWRPRPGRSMVTTTDMLVEGIHFRHDWSNAESIGIRSLAVNVSDIAGMGGRPRIAVVSLGLRGNETDRWVYEFYRGALKIAETYKFRIVGGDIVYAPRATTVSVTINGEISPRKPPLMRDQARVGDVIGVTGPLGLAAGGVKLLTEDQRQLDGAPRMMEAHRRPEPRVLQGILLRWAGVRCGMDLSDGLLGDLPKILERSEVSAELIYDQLPIPHAVRWSFDDWFDLALRGGEDYELLFTCPPENFAVVEKLFKRFGCPAPTMIGTIEKPRESGSPIQLLQTDRRRSDLEPGAHEQFANVKTTRKKKKRASGTKAKAAS